MGLEILYLSIFGLEFENNIVTFEISTLEFVLFQNLTNFETKITLFEYFCAKVLKRYHRNINQYPLIRVIAKFREKKCLDSGTKYLIWKMLD